MDEYKSLAVERSLTVNQLINQLNWLIWETIIFIVIKLFIRQFIELRDISYWERDIYSTKWRQGSYLQSMLRAIDLVDFP